LYYLPDWLARYPVPTAPISFVPELGTDEVLSMFTPKDRLKGLTPEDRLEGLASEEIGYTIHNAFFHRNLLLKV